MFLQYVDRPLFQLQLRTGGEKSEKVRNMESTSSTTDGFASVRESVTSHDADVTAQRLNFQYVFLRRVSRFRGRDVGSTRIHTKN